MWPLNTIETQIALLQAHTNAAESSKSWSMLEHSYFFKIYTTEFYIVDIRDTDVKLSE